MKIKEVKLKNFKFHQDLEFEIGKQNCLIYGENGTGKSSIYEALYSVFTVYFRGRNFLFNKFKNNNSTEALNAKVILDNEIELVIPHDNYNLPTSITRENKKTIYFANQDLLESIISNDNFYDTVKKSFKNTFASLHNFRKKFEYINSRIDSLNYVEEGKKRQDNIEKMKIFLNQVELRANDIIHNHFEEQFSIGFDYTWGLSNTEDDFKYPNPKITLKIDDKKKLKLNFNEAKLKLSSIAIFFALIQLEEDITNPLKILVLDDFLTSLDMGNRKLIVQYVLDNFGEYQKIILTHNIQFYNLIIRLLKLRKKDDAREELSDWDIKNIFIREYEDENLSIIIDKEEDYLTKAKTELDAYELEISGNLLRKEFERIVTEFEQLLELGKVEDMDKILKALVKSDCIFAEAPSKILQNSFPEQITRIKNILNPSPQSDASKLTQVRTEINNFEVSVELKKKVYDTSYLKSVILKTEFYKDILMNYASHNDQEKELHQKEFKKAIELLKALNKILNDLK